MKKDKKETKLQQLQRENKDLREIIEEARDKVYCWVGELDPLFFKKMVRILESSNKDE